MTNPKRQKMPENGFFKDGFLNGRPIRQEGDHWVYEDGEPAALETGDILHVDGDDVLVVSLDHPSNPDS